MHILAAYSYHLDQSIELFYSSHDGEHIIVSKRSAIDVSKNLQSALEQLPCPPDSQSVSIEAYMYEVLTAHCTVYHTEI